MRFVIASAMLVSLSCSFVAGCTPSTPPAQEPVAAPAPSGVGAGGSSAGGSSAGGSSAGGSAATSSGGEVSATGSTATAKMCGGIAGIQCGEKEFCSFAPEAHCGAADMSGTCAKKPDVCIQMVDEVCGCDDKTYSNACMAANAGVSVLTKGPCKVPDTIAEGGLCGTRGVNKDCGAGLYCAFKTDCGATDRGGACTKKTTMCTKIYKPVCGCDGKTYGNACTAGADGISIMRDGACKK